MICSSSENVLSSYIVVIITYRVQAWWGVSIPRPSRLLCAHPCLSRTKGLSQDMPVFSTESSWTLSAHALLPSGLLLAWQS